MKICAGLDLSLTNAGVAIISSPSAVAFHSFGYSLPRKATNRDHLERVIFIANSILRVLKRSGTRFVGIENYAFGGQRLTVQADLGGVVKSQLYLAGILPILMPASAVRKFVMGKDKRDKKLVRSHLVEKLGYPPPGNLDESDALAVGHVVFEWANRRLQASGEHAIELFTNIDYHLTKTADYGLL